MCEAVRDILTAPMKLHNKITDKIGLPSPTNAINKKLIKKIDGKKPAPGVPTGLNIPTGPRPVKL